MPLVNLGQLLEEVAQGCLFRLAQAAEKIGVVVVGKLRQLRQNLLSSRR